MDVYFENDDEIDELIYEYLLSKKYTSTASAFLIESPIGAKVYDSPCFKKRRLDGRGNYKEKLHKDIKSKILDYFLSSDAIVPLVAPIRKIETALNELNFVLHLKKPTSLQQKKFYNKTSVSNGNVRCEKSAKSTITEKNQIINAELNIRTPEKQNSASVSEPFGVFRESDIIAQQCNDKTPKSQQKFRQRKTPNSKLKSGAIINTEDNGNSCNQTASADVFQSVAKVVGEISPKIPEKNCHRNAHLDATTIAVFEPEKWEQVVQDHVSNGFSLVPDAMAEMINNCKAYSAGQEPTLDEIRATIESNAQVMQELQLLLSDYCRTDDVGDNSDITDKNLSNDLLLGDDNVENLLTDNRVIEDDSVDILGEACSILFKETDKTDKITAVDKNDKIVVQDVDVPSTSGITVDASCVIGESSNSKSNENNFAFLKPSEPKTNGEVSAAKVVEQTSENVKTEKISPTINRINGFNFVTKQLFPAPVQSEKNSKDIVNNVVIPKVLNKNLQVKSLCSAERVESVLRKLYPKK